MHSKVASRTLLGLLAIGAGALAVLAALAGLAVLAAPARASTTTTITSSSTPSTTPITVPTTTPGTTTPGQPMPTTPLVPYAAMLEQCVPAVERAARYATFAGEMQAVKGTRAMAIRIDLYESLGQSPYELVVAPGLSEWRMSTPGVTFFTYRKQVANLDAPAAFRVAVRFRWIGRQGRTIRFARAITEPCIVPDERPLLAVGAVAMRALTARPQSADYRIAIDNRGRGPAGPFSVQLTVNGAVLAPLTVPALAADGSTLLETIAPRCASGSTVEIAVDPQGLIPESPGGGQPKVVPCTL